MISTDPLIQRRSPTGQVTGLDACPAQGSEQMPESETAAPFLEFYSPRKQKPTESQEAQKIHIVSQQVPR